MNADQLKGKWVQFNGELKQKWVKFTDDDLQQIEGVTKTVIRKALDKFRAAEREWKERRQTLHKQITAVDAGLRRLVSAISTGGDIPILVEAVKIGNDRRETLSQELADVDVNIIQMPITISWKRICRRTLKHLGRHY